MIKSRALLFENARAVTNIHSSHQDKLRHKELMQIIIGAAWVDGELDSSEIQYLTRLLERYGLSHDRDLQALLTSPVSMRQTELWIADYLQDTTETERQSALAAIAKLMIIDDQVSEIEHQLLDDFYEFMAAIPPHSETIQTVVESVGKFFRSAVKTIDRFVSGHEK
jgi:uncharacterized membrane protein YebE (DUF533 family)